ncbi:Cytoplasmic phosphatidylinositol transfer protein 1 Mammalian rdgB -like protein beta [Channa argus]|uniref:Cytoplasmic phosphatidylinositol transfer protein 1 Mammalian rdgB-like protein beta n=1 Tax=Channa argus TaxID=215402 RepID=A0A6G1PBP4_CHAAH|nr:Cytoplasmic phosphatidylinositol transfer protein 1 Mammalian rdgB -like protein beta [Channa argus]
MAALTTLSSVSACRKGTAAFGLFCDKACVVHSIACGNYIYRIGQLYMISKHSHEQSDRGEGVEVVQNEPYEDPTHGQGQFTEKRVYLNSKLPSWARAVVPKIFYVTEKAWNYYPYTITETKYEDNKGCNDNSSLSLLNAYCTSSAHAHCKSTDGKGREKGGGRKTYMYPYKQNLQRIVQRQNDWKIFDTELKDQEREVCFIDVAYDEIPERYYKESEDLRYFKSEKTSRGILQEGWRDTQDPIMCSYKLVTVKFEVWGLQTRVEQFIHKVVRDVLLLGHRQAFAWVDEWIDMTLDDVRDYETQMHEKTNIKVCHEQQEQSTTNPSSLDDIEIHDKANMTMDEVREFERTIQEATNQKIGMFPPSISISETPLSSCALTGPASAPSTPMCTDAPESLSVPKDRPRKKSAPETLTLPDPVSSSIPQGSTLSPQPISNHLQSGTPLSSSSDLSEMDEH